LTEVSEQRWFKIKRNRASSIQKSICSDSIVSNSNSTASFWRLFQHHRSKAVIAVMFAARPLFPHEQTFAGTHRTVVSMRRHSAMQQISTEQLFASPLAFDAAWQAHRKYRTLAGLARHRHVAAHHARELAEAAL
jgi:hypothetical protein